jgi:hypothetical protein
MDYEINAYCDNPRVMFLPYTGCTKVQWHQRGPISRASHESPVTSHQSPVGSRDDVTLTPSVARGREAGHRLQSAIETCLREHRTAATEYTIPLAGGRGYFEARIIPLAVDRVVAVVRDITSQRRLEEGLSRVPGIRRAAQGGAGGAGCGWIGRRRRADGRTG